jgi:hypothetical protein
VAPDLTHKHYTRLEKIAKDKHSSLIKASKATALTRKGFIAVAFEENQPPLKLKIKFPRPV